MGFFDQLGKLASEKGRYQQMLGTERGAEVYEFIKIGRDNRLRRGTLREHIHAAIDRFLDEKWGES